MSWEDYTLSIPTQVPSALWCPCLISKDVQWRVALCPVITRPNCCTVLYHVKVLILWIVWFALHSNKMCSVDRWKPLLDRWDSKTLGDLFKYSLRRLPRTRWDGVLCGMRVIPRKLTQHPSLKVFQKQATGPWKSSFLIVWLKLQKIRGPHANFASPIIEILSFLSMNSDGNN